MIKILKRHRSLFLLLFLAIIIRLGYACVSPNIYITPDSKEYYFLGKQFIDSPSVSKLVNPYRVMVYPVFIASIIKSNLGHFPEIESDEFKTGAQKIMFIQHVFGLIGVMVLYLTLRLIRISGKLLWVFMSFHLFNVNVFMWERTILTESLAISLGILMTYLSLLSLKKPSNRNLLLLLLCFWFGFLLRPSFIFFPIPILALIIFRHLRRFVVKKVVVVGIVFFALPFLYLGLNYRYYGYKGITYVGHIDILGRILQKDIPVDGGRKYSYFYEKIIDYRRKREDLSPWKFLNYYDSMIYTSPQKLNELQSFVNSILLSNLGSYVLESIRDIPVALMEPNPNLVINESGGFISDFYTCLFNFYNFIKFFYLLFLLIFALVLAKILIKNSFKESSIVMIGVIATAQIITTMLILYAEYYRFFSLIQPHMFLVVLLFLENIWKRNGAESC